MAIAKRLPYKDRAITDVGPGEKPKPFWKGYIYFGGYTLVQARDGMGKSKLCLDLCARVTANLPMPGESANPFGENRTAIYMPEQRESMNELKNQFVGETTGDENHFRVFELDAPYFTLDNIEYLALVIGLDPVWWTPR